MASVLYGCGRLLVPGLGCHLESWAQQADIITETSRRTRELLLKTSKYFYRDHEIFLYSSSDCRTGVTVVGAMSPLTGAMFHCGHTWRQSRLPPSHHDTGHCAEDRWPHHSTRPRMWGWCDGWVKSRDQAMLGAGPGWLEITQLALGSLPPLSSAARRGGAAGGGNGGRAAPLSIRCGRPI